MTCDYCHLRWVRRWAADRSMRYIVRQLRGRVDVHAVPLTVRASEHNRMASFKQLPTKCECELEDIPW